MTVILNLYCTSRWEFKTNKMVKWQTLRNFSFLELFRSSLIFCKIRFVLTRNLYQVNFFNENTYYKNHLFYYLSLFKKMFHHSSQSQRSASNCLHDSQQAGVRHRVVVQRQFDVAVFFQPFLTARKQKEFSLANNGHSKFGHLSIQVFYRQQKSDGY